MAEALLLCAVLLQPAPVTLTPEKRAAILAASERAAERARAALDAALGATGGAQS